MNEQVLTLTETKHLYKHLYKVIKRGLDIIFSSILLVLCLPIFLVIALLIKIEDGGKVFFKHKRIGQYGQPISIYKFRTMVENAEELLKTLSKEELEEYEKNYKMKNDFRITKVGKVLRQTSLDELPQLLNILEGNMSLIGPRPIVSKELEKYGKNKNKFLSVTPGLTGLWASSGRSNISYKERIKLELYYVDNFSFALDVKCFFKTIDSIVRRTGAR